MSNVIDTSTASNTSTTTFVYDVEDLTNFFYSQLKDKGVYWLYKDTVDNTKKIIEHDDNAENCK